jgi:hypothetical protein
VLLGVGLPPVTANVSNSVGLFPGSFVGAYGYRRELVGQRRRAIVLSVASAFGGAGGAVLLLELPAEAFKAIVPVLIALALILVVFGPRITKWLRARGREPRAHVRWPLFATTVASGVYGGYFGAAQGVLVMGLFGLFLAESLQRQNALKNVVVGVVNLVSSIVFVATAHIDWAAAGLIAAGAITGGWLGAHIGRRLSPMILRGVIVVVGIAAIVKLLV